MSHLTTILLLAVLLDTLLGDPPSRVHPVRWMGHWAGWLESWFYREGRKGLVPGFLVAFFHPFLVVTVYLVVRWGVAHFPFSWAVFLFDALAFYACFAFRDLFDHARPILNGLERGDLGAAQAAVQRIIGRDAALLDASGVARAAVESVAESLGDGALGPLFWFTAGGLIASGPLQCSPFSAAAVATASALVFRAVNTLDSMFGSKSERYLYFGRTCARLDDVLAFLPARCAVFFLALAASLLRLDLRAGVATWWRDGGRHPSPNAGQSESFVAGALGLRLGGPAVYPYGTVDKAWMGEGRQLATAEDLRRACRLVRWAGFLAVVVSAVMISAVIQLILKGDGI